MINIDYASEEMMSAKYQYNGATEDGRKFVLHAEWNSWDDYVAEDIEWLDGATGTYEEECEIYELYQETMNV
jgi:hypothetical protein